MKTIEKPKVNKKKTYLAPKIEVVKLDREISVMMQSPSDLPPPDPENGISLQDYFNINPFKIFKF